MTDQPTGWLTDATIIIIVMTDKTTDLISSPFCIILSQDFIFSNQKGYSSCIVVYPVPFLTHQVDDDSQLMWHGFSKGLVDCSGTADTYSLLGLVWSWHFKHMQLKKNCLQHITLGQAFLQVKLTKLCSGRIDCRDAFLAAYCFKDCINGPTKPKERMAAQVMFLLTRWCAHYFVESS